MRWLPFLLLLFLPCLLPAQHWHLAPSPLPCLSNQLYFCSPDTGFVFGLYDQQYRTTDGGRSWSFFPLPASASITQVHFPDAQWGYIAGSLEQGGAGVVYRSANAGKDWQAVSPPQASAIQTLHFANPQQGLCIDGQGLLFLTQNGGETWSIRDTLQGISHQALWLNDSVCILSGRVPSAATRPRIGRTEDGGQSWTFFNVPLNNSETIALEKISATEIGVFFNARNTGGNNRWMYSDDQGANWLLEELPIVNASDFAFEGARLWVCSRDGNIYRSGDRGASFENSYQGELEWRKLQMLNPQRGYALGGFEQLLRWEAPAPEMEEERSFRLWPNPAAAQQPVQVQLPPEVQGLQVYSFLGQLVAEYELNGQNNWSLELNQGLYTIVIRTDKGRQTRSLIIH